MTDFLHRTLDRVADTLRAAHPPKPEAATRAEIGVDELAAIIRYVDGSHSKGAGELAESIIGVLELTGQRLARSTPKPEAPAPAEADARDAARYRWLRSQKGGGKDALCVARWIAPGVVWQFFDAQGLDAAIDAALTSGGKAGARTEEGK